MKIKITFFLILITLITSLPLAGFTQCNAFGKKCSGKLSPYFNSGQMFNSTLLSQDHAKLSMTFYKGQNYRVLVCSEEDLGEVKFNLIDASNNIIFTNKGYGNFWDFNVEATQELIVEVITPPAYAKDNLDKSGCVTILVGFKQ